MRAYSEAYLHDIVENQGKLFDLVSQEYPDKDTADFINAYMRSRTRGNIDDCQVYVSTKTAEELLQYFVKNERYEFKSGKGMAGFMPDWIGEFYAYYQWYYNIKSMDVIDKIPLEFLSKAYYGLHDLSLDLAVKKVGYQA